VQFHALLLEMTGSRMIAGMQQVLVNYFAKAPRFEHTPNNAQRIIWEHRELFLAVHDRDVERARSMVRMHFRQQQQAMGQGAAPTTPVSPA